MIAVLAAAMLLAAGPPAPEHPPAPAPRDGDAQPAPPPLSQEDAAVVEHLELLQKLELLQDLNLVDTGADEADARKEEQPKKP